MKTLSELRKQTSKAHKVWLSLQNKLDVAEDKVRVPSLKKKYEGKFFKYNNGINHEVKWWLYSFCIKVTDDAEFIIDSFEICEANDNQHIFQTLQQVSHSHLFQTEISSIEYSNELVKFRAKMLQMVNTFVNRDIKITLKKVK